MRVHSAGYSLNLYIRKTRKKHKNQHQAGKILPGAVSSFPLVSAYGSRFGSGEKRQNTTELFWWNIKKSSWFRKKSGTFWWRLLDSNQWPPACEAGALTSGARRTARNPCYARVSTVLSVPWNLRFYLLEHMRPIMVLYTFRCSGNQMFGLNYTSSHIFYRLWRTTNKWGTTLKLNRTSYKRNKEKEYELSLWGIQQYWISLLL